MSFPLNERSRIATAEMTDCSRRPDRYLAVPTYIGSTRIEPAQFRVERKDQSRKLLNGFGCPPGIRTPITCSRGRIMLQRQYQSVGLNSNAVKAIRGIYTDCNYY